MVTRVEVKMEKERDDFDDIDDIDDFELIDATERGIVSNVYYAENLDQGHNMCLGDRVKLSLREMAYLKEIIDKEINSGLTNAAEEKNFTVNTKLLDKGALRLSADNYKLSDIPVVVEEVPDRILVKVGPCDLSGVGGHHIRAQIIKLLVTEALQDKGLDKRGYTFENVNVSACVGVRGRLQMALGLLVNNREEVGTHMNAYIKTDKENHLVHWEPRKGPQRWYNDTICAMVTSTTTSIFEQGIRSNTIQSARQATTDILKHSSLVRIFDELLNKTKDRISGLIENIKNFVTKEDASVNMCHGNS